MCSKSGRNRGCLLDTQALLGEQRRRADLLFWYRRSSCRGSEASDAESRSARPLALMPLSIIATLPGPLDLLADERPPIREMQERLFGGRHLLAA
jgi:hypothetical protein